MGNTILRSIVNSDLIFSSLLWLNWRQRLFYVGEGGMTARLRLNVPWLENCGRQDCDISHSNSSFVKHAALSVTTVSGIH